MDMNCPIHFPILKVQEDAMTRATALSLTTHAQRRMDGRRIPAEAVEAVLAHGREAWVRGACIHALGNREVTRGYRQGLDLRPYAGLQVVCSPEGDILTVYRNHDFRSLRRAA
jgi:hypothetical protein